MTPDLLLRIGGSILGVIIILLGVGILVYMVPRPDLLTRYGGDSAAFAGGGFLLFIVGVFGGGVILILFSIGVYD